MKVLFYCLLVILWPGGEGMGQGKQKNSLALTVGDTLPENLRIPNIIADPNGELELLEFKGKFLLLDFWATWCLSCIAAMPTVERLHSQFADDLNVLLINPWKGDVREKIDIFINRQARKGLPVKFPIAYQDTILSKYFPHKVVPHYVLLGRNLEVLAISDKRILDEKIIREAVSGNIPRLPIKNDDIKFDRGTPLLVNDNGGPPDDFLYRSILTGYIEGLGYPSGKKIDSGGKIIRLYYINHTIKQLLQAAYKEELKSSIPGVLLQEYSDSARSSDLDSRFCYELITPPSNPQLIGVFFKLDIWRSFGLSIVVENRPVKYYELVVVEPSRIPITKGGTPEYITERSEPVKFLTNQPIGTLASVLFGFDGLPVFDGTNTQANIDIQIPGDIKSSPISYVQGLLANWGLALKMVEAEKPAAIITDKFPSLYK